MALRANWTFTNENFRKRISSKLILLRKLFNDDNDKLTWIKKFANAFTFDLTYSQMA